MQFCILSTRSLQVPITPKQHNSRIEQKKRIILKRKPISLLALVHLIETTWPQQEYYCPVRILVMLQQQRFWFPIATRVSTASQPNKSYVTEQKRVLNQLNSDIQTYHSSVIICLLNKVTAIVQTACLHNLDLCVLCGH